VSFKAALAGLNVGGRYITAEDVGSYIPDMDVVSLPVRDRT
jgi:hypothetical protein